MRILISLVCLSSFVTPTHASERQRLRPATEQEIKQALPGFSQLSERRGAFFYEPGGQVGYSVSPGKLCVRDIRGDIDCMRVNSNGTKIQMIDESGNRENLQM